MNRFLRWGLPLLVLVVSLTVIWFLPEGRFTQVVASLIVGVIMLSIRSLIGYPNVVIEELREEVTCQQMGNRLICTTLGKIINRSSTGEGELRELILRIYLSQDDYLDIPLEETEDIDSNYRFHPHGRYPARQLWFALSPSHHTIEET